MDKLKEVLKFGLSVTLPILSLQTNKEQNK
jgi:hypothetical protein